MYKLLILGFVSFRLESRESLIEESLIWIFSLGVSELDLFARWVKPIMSIRKRENIKG